MSNSKKRGPNLVYNCEADDGELTVRRIVSQRITERLHTLHITEREASARMDEEVSPSQLSKYMNCKSEPNATMLYYMTQGMACSADYFLGLEDEVNPQDDGYIQRHTGLSREAVKFLAQHQEANSLQADTANGEDFALLSGMLVAGGNHLMHALLDYARCANHARVVTVKAERLNKDRLTYKELREWRDKLNSALHDLDAADMRLMVWLNRAKEEAARSADTREKLEEQEAMLRTKVNG